MKNIICIVPLLFLFLGLSAQKEDYQWVIGGNGGIGFNFRSNLLDFNGDSLTVSQLDIDWQSQFVVSQVCDSNGVLAVYSDGGRIFNGQHELVENGDQFNPLNQSCYKPMGTLMLNFPGHKDQYLLLEGVEGGYYQNFAAFLFYSPLRYSVIDMAENNGAGKVVQKSIPISTDSIYITGMTACRHANGRDWWVIGSAMEKGAFVVYLVDPEGVKFSHLEYTEMPILNGGVLTSFSPDGNWFALRTLGEHIYPENKSIYRLFLYQFDRCTGKFTFTLKHRYPETIGGGMGNVFFSPNSRYMYSILRTKIVQYNLHAPSILDSETKVAEYDGFVDEVGFNTMFYMGKLAPDGKVYIAVLGGNSRWLHRMEHPNEPGVACQVTQHALQLPCYNRFMVPNTPEYRLGPVDGSACDSLGLNSTKYVATKPFGIVQPNPTTGNLFVRYAQPVPAQGMLRLYNMTQRTVLQQRVPTGAETTQLDLSGLPNGVYFLHFVDGAGPYRVERVVVQR